MRTRIYWKNQGREEYVGDAISGTFVTTRNYKHWFRIYSSFFSLSKDLLIQLIARHSITHIIIVYTTMENKKEYYTISVADIYKFAKHYTNEKGGQRDEQLVIAATDLKRLNKKPEVLRDDLRKWMN